MDSYVDSIKNIMTQHVFVDLFFLEYIEEDFKMVDYVDYQTQRFNFP